jgi:hypothetical protein
MLQSPFGYVVVTQPSVIQQASTSGIGFHSRFKWKTVNGNRSLDRFTQFVGIRGNKLKNQTGPWQHAGLFIALGLSIAVLQGCATKELRAARDECRPKSYAQFPADRHQEPVTRSRAVQVPTGRTDCTVTTSGSRVDTTCIEEMRTEYQDYTALAMVDRNEPAREAFVNSCARDICQSRFGNPQCK